ncbi:MAG: ABC transporter ATP-binding protein/permease [Muribaculaceae bacterium]|nr:ABC transporter ATP-binding protein/permease [Muribaculaceae bacterium]
MRRFIVELTGGFRWRIVLTAAAGIIRVAAGLMFVAVSRQAVDIAAHQAEGDLWKNVAVLILTIVIELICSSFAARNTDLTEAELKNALQDRFFSRLMSSGWEGHEKMHSGDMISRLTDDCRVASESLCRTFPAVIVACFQLMGAFFFLWYFSHALAAILFLLFPLFLLAGKVFFRRVRVLTRRIRATESRIQEKMQESLQHRILLTSYQYAGRVVDSVRALHSSRYTSIRRKTDHTVYSKAAVTAGFESGYLIAFIWGLIGLGNGTISFGTMAAYLQLAGRIQHPMAELAGLLPGLTGAHTAFLRLSEIGAVSPEESGLENLPSMKPAGIDFRNVSFSYLRGGKKIISGFSHAFKPGQFTAIMGETGAGKTTLLRLMLGLLRPQEGEIRILACEDNEHMSDIGSFLGRIVYVPQGNSILSGTIRSNLKIGNPDASDAEMYAALHDAAADFVKDLRFGLDTPCRERGGGLSEGQAQRIAIARGLLREGSILLLDEISAALDEETEKTLMSRLGARRGKHTVIFVTHRGAVLPYCDDVVRL